MSPSLSKLGLLPFIQLLAALWTVPVPPQTLRPSPMGRMINDMPVIKQSTRMVCAWSENC